MNVLERLAFEIAKFSKTRGAMPAGHSETLLRDAHEEIARLREPRPEVDARERLLNQIIELCERLDDCSAGYAGERIRDDFLIGRKDEAHPSPTTTVSFL